MQRETKRLAPDAMRALMAYDWPGNVRELEHAIERAMVLGGKDVITAADLPFTRQPAREVGGTAPGLGLVGPAQPHGLATAPQPAMWTELAELNYGEAKRRLLAEFDESYTSEILRRTSGNMSEAARRAGLDRSNFRRLLKRHKDEP